MKIDIFKSFNFGKETFQPLSYDENSFVMNWSMKAGGFVPTHYHEHMDEHFLVTKGNISFTVNGEKVIKKEGETLFVPKGIAHSIKNTTDDDIAIQVTYTPCADAHRMFEILAVLDEKKSGSMLNLIKYLYLAPRLGLRSFSTPHPAFAATLISFIVNVLGGILGWKKLVTSFKHSN